MPQVSREGRYRATLSAWKCDVSEKSGYVQFIATCQCVARYNADVKAEEQLEKPETITAFLMLEGKNGINQHQIDALKAALGWDGKDIDKLSEGPWDGREVSVSVEQDEYEGKTRLRVSWINPLGGLKPVTEDTKATIKSRWQALMTGTKPAPVAASTEGF